MRLGTPAVTTRGMKEADMTRIVQLIDKVLANHTDEAVIASVKEEVNGWMSKFPLYQS
jgi:glycine hydroxymethyltransferase